MSENRFASEEFVVEVATWLERVARECSVGAPFLGRDDGTLVTASGAFFNSVGVPQGDGRPPEEQVSVGVSMPLDRLMRHCNLTEDQAIEAVELASTTPQLGVSIYVEVGPRGEQVIRLSKKIPPGDISKFGAEMDAAMKEGEWRRSRDS